jgi:hypothetical protein
MIQLAAAVSTSDTIRYVTIYDDAVDIVASDLDAYLKTYDLAHLSIREGMTPTYFILRPCSQAEVRRANTAVAAKTPDLHNRIAAIGGELLRVGLVGADNLAKAGDSHRWPNGCPPALLDGGVEIGGALVQIPSPIQEMLAVALYHLSEGPARDGGMGDEGKSRSPSSLSGAGTSEQRASTATPVKAKNGGGEGARKRRS